MVGLLIITHGQLAKEFLKTVEYIIGFVELVKHVSIDALDDPEDLRDTIEKKIASLEKGDGVIILTDMFGGTPSNVALSFLQKNKVEIVTGINLPMVLSVAQNKDKVSLTELAETAKKAGQRSISLASEILEPKKT